MKNTFYDKDWLYKTYLREINGIKFTAREVDIISCVVHNRGNKKIASLLSIAYRTVDAHIYNITSKINKNSKDDIIDFAEKSGKMSYIRRHYSYILIEDKFYKTLLNISRNINKTPITRIISASNFIHTSKESNVIICQKLQKLQNDLKMANIILNVNTPEIAQCYILSHDNKIQNMNKDICLIFDDIMPSTKEIDYIDFTTSQNYYLSVFDLLKKLINPYELDIIKDRFQKEYNYLIDNNQEQQDIDIKLDENIEKNTIFSTIKERSALWHKLYKIFRCSIYKGYRGGFFAFLQIIFCLVPIFAIFYGRKQKSTADHSIYEASKIQEFSLIKNKVKESAEYYNTDQTNTDFAKQNNKNILTLQKDVDYLNKHSEYLYEDDTLQSQFSYLACVLSSHYRWNKDIDMSIDEYISTEYNECSKFFNNEIERLHLCVSSVIVDRMIKYYQNRYKFTDQDSIQSIKYKLQREHYALDDFILLSYYRARGYFSINSWDEDDLQYVNKYLDFVLLNDNPNKPQLFEIFLAKKYKLIVERNHIEAFIQKLYRKLKEEFQETKDEKNLVSTTYKIRLNPENVKKLNRIINLSKNNIQEKLQKLKNINSVLSDLLNDGSTYINHYRPWSIDSPKTPVETIIPKENKFNIATICGEMALTHSIIITYNTLLYNATEDPRTLYIANKENLLDILEILRKFVTNKQIKDHWNDIGINYTKQKIKHSIEIIASADLGDKNHNIKLKIIIEKLFNDKCDNNITNDIEQLSLDLKNN